MNLSEMKKKLPTLLIIITILLVLAIIFFLIRKPSKKPLTPLSEKSLPGIEEQFTLKTWEDPAGFSFNYPEILKIDIHEEDEISYAHLELTREGKPGRMLVIVNDSNYSTLDQWLKEDKEVKDASALDTQVAEMKAKKVALKEGKEITAFIDLDQVIYKIIKEPKGENFWNQVYKTILDSFKFIPLEGESEETFQNWLEGFETSDVDVVEPVEIIE